LPARHTGRESLYVDLGKVSIDTVDIDGDPFHVDDRVRDHILRIGLNCRFDGPVVARYCGTRLLRRHLYEIVQFAWNLQGRRSLDIRACQLRNRRYVPLNGKTAFPAATKLGRLA